MAMRRGTLLDMYLIVVAGRGFVRRCLCLDLGAHIARNGGSVLTGIAQQLATVRTSRNWQSTSLTVIRRWLHGMLAWLLDFVLV